MPDSAPATALDVSIVIAAPSGRVLGAFFDANAIGAWWQAARSVTIPRTLGPYAVEWNSTDFEDDVLGRLGGVFRGTVMQCQPSGFFLADVYWLPPDGEPVGPMAFEVACEALDENSTRVRVRQTGFEDSARWRRYYEVIDRGWQRALASLKSLLEK
jgi:uncharacterized protein YndB with AHSA1/START domain